jgi:hypothetical protein
VRKLAENVTNDEIAQDDEEYEEEATDETQQPDSLGALNSSKETTSLKS